MVSIDLVGSLIIGGLVMLMILGFTFWYMNTSRDIIIDESQRGVVSNFAEIMEKEFKRMGYGMDSTAIVPKVVAVDTVQKYIEFYGDINNDGYINRVKYFLRKGRKGNELVRRAVFEDRVREFSVPVNDFSLSPKDSLGNPTSTASALRQLKVEVQFAEGFFQEVDYSTMGGSGYYSKYIVPKNLEVK